MPELPEVETVARQLDPLAAGQLIKGVEILDPLLAFSHEKRLVGRRIGRVRRIGKEVVFQLEDYRGKASDLLLAVHLRMTGRLIYQGKTDVGDRGDKYLRAVLALEQGTVRFHDMRRFGTMKIYESALDAEPAGAEPLDRRFNAASLAALINGSSMEIKVWLLRQDRICGIGNIYASEILHDCGIDPFRPAASLSQSELELLAGSTKKILRKAIKHCGTTFSDFQNANGEVGGYQKYLRVYQHSGEGCHHCGTEIQRAVQAQRSTFWCPACQR